jgi:hypothetical protein
LTLTGTDTAFELHTWAFLSSFFSIFFLRPCYVCYTAPGPLMPRLRPWCVFILYYISVLWIKKLKFIKFMFPFSFTPCPVKGPNPLQRYIIWHYTE